MTDARSLRGTVDRIVDGVATILVEGEVHLAERALPAGTREGDVVRFDVSAGFVVVDVDEQETAARRAGIEDRVDRLRSERSGGRFDDGRDDAGDGADG